MNTDMMRRDWLAMGQPPVVSRDGCADTDTRTAAASIDTAYFHSVEPFDGEQDHPDGGDVAATKIWVDPCSIGDGLDVTLAVDRTNIRVDMSVAEARKLATFLYIAANAAEG